MLIKYLSIALLILDGSSAAIDSSSFKPKNEKSLVIDSSKNKDAIDSNNVIEYHKDHEVTEREAREFLQTLTWEELKGEKIPGHETPITSNLDILEPPLSCQAMKCSQEHVNYCKSENLLKDHCCCEMGHSQGE